MGACTDVCLRAVEPFYRSLVSRGRPLSALSRDCGFQLSRLLRGKPSAQVVMHWLDREDCLQLTATERARVWMEGLLHEGSDILSHVQATFERYKEVFKRSFHTPEARAAMVTTVLDVWAHSSQHATFVLDKLVAYHFVDAVSVVQGVLHATAFARAHVWEIVHNTATTTVRRTQKIQKALQDLQAQIALDAGPRADGLAKVCAGSRKTRVSGVMWCAVS